MIFSKIIDPVDMFYGSHKIRNSSLFVDVFLGTRPIASESLQDFPLLPVYEQVIGCIGIWLHIGLGSLVLQ